MKIYIKLALACVFALSVIACSKKATKEEVIIFYEKITEYVSSAEFKNILAEQKKGRDTELAVERKMLEIAKSMGFEALSEMKAPESVMNSPEVKKIIDDFNTAQKNAILGAVSAENASVIHKAESEAKTEHNAETHTVQPTEKADEHKH